MTQIEILQNVIGRWEAFCYNYRSTTKNGITYPEVLEIIQWANGDADYIRNKWEEVCERNGCNGSAALHLFFRELDTENQQALLEHVYNGRA